MAATVPSDRGRWEPWMDSALCAETAPEAFFPEGNQSTRDAMAICAACTVQAACLEYALRNNERHGIYGGLTARQRAQLKRNAA